MPARKKYSREFELDAIHLVREQVYKSSTFGTPAVGGAGRFYLASL